MKSWGAALAIGLFAVVWEGIARLPATEFLIAGPIAIAAYLWENAGLMARAAGATSWSAAQGFVWGNLAAFAIAAAATLVPKSERLITALALLIFCLPLVATGPILRVLFGPGSGPQITLAALAVYYTSYLALMVGFRAIPQAWDDLMRIYGRGPLTTLTRVRLMASLPYLFVSLQIAAPAAFLGAMIGEFTGAERGMGVLTLRAMRSLDVDATWSLALVSAGVAILAFAAVGWLRRWLTLHEPVLILSPLRSDANATTLFQRLAILVLSIVSVIALWQAVMDIFDLNRFFAKRPLDVWQYLVSDQSASENRATLFAALWETLVLTVPGYLAGLAAGAGLAMLLILSPVLRTIAMPIAIALRSVPIITTAPLLILALGRGATGTITIVAVMIFFPTLVACLQGLRQTPGQIVDIFDSYGASRWQLLLSARVPAMLPALFAAARMAVPAALLAVTTTEWLATGKGIGNLMALTATTSNYNMLWSAIVVLSVCAVVLYLLVERLEKAVLRVYASEQVSG